MKIFLNDCLSPFHVFNRRNAGAEEIPESITHFIRHLQIITYKNALCGPHPQHRVPIEVGFICPTPKGGIHLGNAFCFFPPARFLLMAQTFSATTITPADFHCAKSFLWLLRERRFYAPIANGFS